MSPSELQRVCVRPRHTPTLYCDAGDALTKLPTKEEWDRIRKDMTHAANQPQPEAPVHALPPGGGAWWSHCPARESTIVPGEDSISIDTDDTRRAMAAVVHTMRANVRLVDAKQLEAQYVSRVAAFDVNSFVIIISGSFQRYAENPFPGSRSSGVFAAGAHKVGPVHTRTYPHASTLTHLHTVTYTNAHMHSLPVAHTRTVTHTRTRTHALTQSHTPDHAHNKAHTHAHSHTRTHTHTHAQTHTHTHVHTHAHAHAYTRHHLSSAA